MQLCAARQCRQVRRTVAVIDVERTEFPGTTGCVSLSCDLIDNTICPQLPDRQLELWSAASVPSETNGRAQSASAGGRSRTTSSRAGKGRASSPTIARARVRFGAERRRVVSTPRCRAASPRVVSTPRCRAASPRAVREAELRTRAASLGGSRPNVLVRRRRSSPVAASPLFAATACSTTATRLQNHQRAEHACSPRCGASSPRARAAADHVARRSRERPRPGRSRSRARSCGRRRSLHGAHEVGKQSCSVALSEAEQRQRRQPPCACLSLNSSTPLSPILSWSGALR